MKNLYSKTIKKFLFFKKGLKILISNWLNALKKDFSLHNSHTEILAIWTVLFITITGLFALAIKSNLLVMLMFFIFSVVIMFAGAFVTVYYLHALKYHNKKRLLPKIHNLLNKSFKLRALLRYIKIPHVSILNNLAKNFKLAS